MCLWLGVDLQPETLFIIHYCYKWHKHGRLKNKQKLTIFRALFCYFGGTHGSIYYSASATGHSIALLAVYRDVSLDPCITWWCRSSDFQSPSGCRWSCCSTRSLWTGPALACTVYKVVRKLSDR